MSTLTSALPYAGTIPSSHPRTQRWPKNARVAQAETRTTASTSIFGILLRASAANPEKFYQDHVTAIFMGIFLETALGPLMGILGVFLYSHLM